MRTALIAAAFVLASGASVAAAAQAPRMNQSEFGKAVECLAYANMDALKADRPNLATLESRMETELAERPRNTRNEVAAETRRIRMSVGDIGTAAEVERAAAKRDRACRRFVEAEAAPAG